MQRIITVLLTILSCCCTTLSAQEIIRVTGKVVAKPEAQSAHPTADDKAPAARPLYGVNVYDTDTKRVLAQTDPDGRFAIDVRSNTTLVFSMIGAKKISVKVKGRNVLEVEMEMEDMFLGEASVVAKRIVNKLEPEHTEIEIKGNYAIFHNKLRVPREMFAHNVRAIAQPVMLNAATNETFLMRPIVLDSKEYNRTQQRMYDFDIDGPEGDPLARNIVVEADSFREKGRNTLFITVADSAYIKNPRRAQLLVDTYTTLENYNRILYRDTTSVAQGTVNPLRWLDFSLSAHEITDEALYPKAEVQLRDAKGNVDLRFPVAKSAFDPNDPHNVVEIDKMRRQVDEIRATRDATLQALTISGTSSPEGIYKNNLLLARQRMGYALDYMRAQVPDELRRNMKFKSEASVAGWDDVAKLMRADSLFDEADRVMAIVNSTRGIDAQGKKIIRLPFYQTVIKPKYLPRLRNVSYTMNYSIFRQLHDDEIRELYKKDYRQLSRYEFFRLYRAETDTAAREKELRQALEIYPSFMVAANDLQVMLLARKQPDPDLLVRFAGKNAPVTVNLNQAAALLIEGEYTAADTLMPYLPDTEETKLIRGVCDVFNGRVDKGFDVVANMSPLNKVAMLLAMKKNKEAFAESKRLPDSLATTHYLRAVCLNRLDNAIDAYEELKKAFKMDPSLERIAKLDADVNLLIPETKKEAEQHLTAKPRPAAEPATEGKQ